MDDRATQRGTTRTERGAAGVSWFPAVRGPSLLPAAGRDHVEPGGSAGVSGPGGTTPMCGQRPVR